MNNKGYLCLLCPKKIKIVPSDNVFAMKIFPWVAKAARVSNLLPKLLISYFVIITVPPWCFCCILQYFAVFINLSFGSISQYFILFHCVLPIIVSCSNTLRLSIPLSSCLPFMLIAAVIWSEHPACLSLAALRRLPDLPWSKIIDRKLETPKFWCKRWRRYF